MAESRCELLGRCSLSSEHRKWMGSEGSSEELVDLAAGEGQVRRAKCRGA